MCNRFGVLAEPVLADPLLFGDCRSALAALNAPVDTPVSAADAVDGVNASQVAPPAPVRRLYEDMGSYQHVQHIFERLLEVYNMHATRRMQLVFFEDALDHLTRIHRVLSLPLVRRAAVLLWIDGRLSPGYIMPGCRVQSVYTVKECV
jgi:dynein heavy chain, axonemal